MAKKTTTTAAASAVSHSRLLEVLDYDPVSGVFRWKKTLSRRAAAGAEAGCRTGGDGRVYISIDRRLYLAHRLAWFFVHASWPNAGIDHRDGNPGNNAINNLREATQAENSQNQRRPHRRNSSGLLGVKRSGKMFRGTLKVGQMRVLGVRRLSPEEAHADYVEIKRVFHPFCTL